MNAHQVRTRGSVMRVYPDTVVVRVGDDSYVLPLAAFEGDAANPFYGMAVWVEQSVEKEGLSLRVIRREVEPDLELLQEIENLKLTLDLEEKDPEK